MSIVKYSLPGAALLLLGASFVHAQTTFDVNVGGGTAWDSANSGGIDNASSSNSFGSCTPGSGDSYCQSLPSLHGFFLGFGGDLMLYKHFGVGVEATLQPSRQTYGPLDSRQTFYDVNGIYAPFNVKRVSLQLQGGLGGARTSFAYTQRGCVGTAVCTTSTTAVGSANHFQVHAGVGVEVFLTSHIFIRPEFGFHYVPGFTSQFGSNYVPQGMVWVGYSFGER